jgi:hypothetical protein
MTPCPSPKEPKSSIKVMLSEEQIKEFQRIYKNFYGKEISREDAYEQGVKLIRLIQLIYKPMTEVEFQQLQKRRIETNHQSK